jgi:hypothetical protein
LRHSLRPMKNITGEINTNPVTQKILCNFTALQIRAIVSIFNRKGKSGQHRAAHLALSGAFISKRESATENNRR